ncbi:MAG: hypothetical protein Kow0077_12200 [Anaerolineae bacterium]
MHRRFTVLTIAGVLLLALVGSQLAPVLAQDGGRPFIGIRFEQRDNGALIVEIVPDSPAASAGLRVNDLITAVNDDPVTLDSPLVQLVQAYAPGDTITLTVDRRGETLDLELVLGTMPEETPAAPPEGGQLRRHIATAGAVFVDMGDHWRVLEVAADSAAEAAALMPGDTVTAIDGHSLASYDTGVLASHARAGEAITLTVLRGSETLELTLQFEPETRVRTFVERVALPERQPPATPGAPPFSPTVEPKGYLGVAFVPLTEEVLAELEAQESLPFDLPMVSEGALVIDVQPDTPAANAGLVPGDVITRVDGDVVDAERTLADRIYAYEAGDTITLEFLRGADVLQIEVTLVARPPELGMPGRPMMPPSMLFAPFMAPDFDLDRFLEENPDFFDQLRERGFGGLFGPMFTDPDFDWLGFLEEHPGFTALLERMVEEFSPDELREIFPGFPWFSDADPFHDGVTPRTPSEGDNAPA